MSAVLATLSGSYPPLEGRSPTCYSAVRHYLRSEDRKPFDLHVLGTPPAFILSQDQTLHRNCPRSIPPYRTNGFLKRSLNRSSRSPPLFDCQRATRAASPDYRSGNQPSRARPVSMPDRTAEGQGEALASADCPTPLPAQYRRRWGVSRPCSGRERVGPPRVGHQGHALTEQAVGGTQ